jgi:hypothetical protein
MLIDGAVFRDPHRPSRQHHSPLKVVWFFEEKPLRPFATLRLCVRLLSFSLFPCRTEQASSGSFMILYPDSKLAS